MFGYVKTLKDELLVKELANYQAVYCGLCRTIRKTYGLYATLFLSYDFTFLALLLDCQGQPSAKNMRCHVKPFKKCKMRCNSVGLEISAAASVILAWHKLSDSIADEKGVKSLLFRIARFPLNRAYQKASKFLPEYAKSAQQAMSEISTLERDNERSLDKIANSFALLLSTVVPQDMENHRIIEQILYHIGRWIYIIDACDDIYKDFKNKNYNAVCACFDIKDGKFTQDCKEQIKFTLENSMASAGLAYQLMPQFADSGIIKNIIYCGIYSVTSQVLNKTDDKQKENNHE